MSRPRFLADHDLSEHIPSGVSRREPAVEFLRARDVGLGDRPDDEVLEYAAEHSLIDDSHDVNTMPLSAYARLRAGKPVAGLFLVKQTDPVGQAIDDLVLIWSATEAEEWADSVCSLPLTRSSAAEAKRSAGRG